MNATAKAAPGGDSPTYLRVREVLRRYASSITVDGLLVAALKRVNLTRAELSRRNLPEFLAALDQGVQMFVQSGDVARLHRDLAAVVDTTSPQP